EVARVEDVALPPPVGAGEVPARISRLEPARVDEDRVIEHLAALAVAEEHRPGERDAFLQPVLANILGQEAGDGVEDAGANLVLERGAEIGRDGGGGRHGFLHAARTREPVAYVARRKARHAGRGRRGSATG